MLQECGIFEVLDSFQSATLLPCRANADLPLPRITLGSSRSALGEADPGERGERAPNTSSSIMRDSPGHSTSPLGHHGCNELPCSDHQPNLLRISVMVLVFGFLRLVRPPHVCRRPPRGGDLRPCPGSSFWFFSAASLADPLKCICNKVTRSSRSSLRIQMLPEW